MFRSIGVGLMALALILPFVVTAGCSKPNTQSTPGDSKSIEPTSRSGQQALPTWTPDSAVLEKLDAYQDIDNYQFRPPKGYPSVSGKTLAPGSKIFGWGGTLRPDQTAPMITVMVVKPMPVQKPPEQLMQDFLNGIKQRRQDWQQSTFERGSVNGLTFLRARWSGTEPTKRWKMHGLMYVAQDGTTLIEISTQDVEPNDKEALKISEAAALTFKRK
jgi:hypothetical protein